MRSIGLLHVVSIYDSTSGLLAVNVPGQQVEWDRPAFDGLTALRVGTVDQTMLQPAGDDTRTTGIFVRGGCSFPSRMGQLARVTCWSSISSAPVSFPRKTIL